MSGPSQLQNGCHGSSHHVSVQSTPIPALCNHSSLAVSGIPGFRGGLAASSSRLRAFLAQHVTMNQNTPLFAHRSKVLSILSCSYYPLWPERGWVEVQQQDQHEFLFPSSQFHRGRTGPAHRSRQPRHDIFPLLREVQNVRLFTSRERFTLFFGVSALPAPRPLHFGAVRKWNWGD